MTVAAALVLLALLLASGDGLLALAPARVRAGLGTGGRRWTLAFATGLVVLQLTFLAAHAAALPWGPWLILLPPVALAAIPLVRPGARPGTVFLTRPLPRAGLGDGAALAALGLFAVLTATGWLIFPDLVYHWGIKAAKFTLARGLDLELLTGPTDFGLHPDYPVLLPVLVAATALLAGAQGPGPGMVWGPIFALVLWLAGRHWLATRSRSHLTLQLSSAALGLYVTFHAVAYRRATDAGWLLALALVLAAPHLERRLRSVDAPHSGLALGLAAALAACAKLEGLPLALFLVVVGAPFGARRGQVGAARWPHWLALLAPPALAGGSWLALVARHDLVAATNWAALRLDRLPVIGRAGLEAASHSMWAGFGFLSLVIAASLWLSTRQRRLAIVCTLQLGFYLLVYLATPVDPVHLVETSFARLLGHLTPALLLGAIVAADVRCDEAPGGVDPER